MKVFLSSFCVLSLFLGSVNAQSKLDSLQRLYVSASNDSLRISIGCSMLADMAKQQPLKAIELGEKLLEDIRQLGSLSDSVRNDWTMQVLNNLSTAYSYVGDNSRSINSLLQALEITQEVGDQRRESISLANIGLAYHYQGMRDEAFSYYRRSLKMDLDQNDVYGIALSYGNIGTLHGSVSPDSSLIYYRLSLSAMQKEGMHDREGAMGWMLNNIGASLEGLGDYDSAFYYYFRSLEIRKSVDHRLGQFVVHKDLAQLFDKTGNDKKALEHINASIAIGEENHYVLAIGNSYLLRSDLRAGKGDYAGALSDYRKFVALRDSSENEDDARDLIKQTMRYEYDRKLLTDSLEFAAKEVVLEERTQKQRVGLFGAGVGLLLVIALAVAIYKGKKRSDELLLNILPEEVAEELKDKGHSDAQLIDHVTVLFTDFKGFTALSEQVTPKELVADLHECFSAFDNICEKYGIEKIKTIGDAYMAAGGLPSPNTTHAQDVVNAALEMAEVIEKGKTSKIATGLPFFEIRIGVHTGPVVAGIVGVKKFQYDIWGDTVNTASRMESSGEVGKVNISESTYQLVKDQFTCEYRGEVEAKGKGKLKMYFVSLVLV
ncbi:MAG: tetratricopeptide repeat protein [Flavobacteriales bacterium]|nr:tetratricopeptide repeat protein [Flavobacteriales bacterium]